MMKITRVCFTLVLFLILSYTIPVGSAPNVTASAVSPILSNLGFQELAMAAASVPSPFFFPLPSPQITIFVPSDESVLACVPTCFFAPSDDSVLACGPSCSSVHLLYEHTVIRAFPMIHLSNLPSGTKLLTTSPDRCLIVTSTTGSDSSVKILVDGVEITHPDLFNDGKIVVHGVSKVIASLSAFSCREVAEL